MDTLILFVEHFLVGAVGEQLFLSYEREPGINAFVRRLKLDLERRGFTVLMDVVIPAGTVSLKLERYPSGCSCRELNSNC